MHLSHLKRNMHLSHRGAVKPGMLVGNKRGDQFTQASGFPLATGPCFPQHQNRTLHSQTSAGH